MRKSHVTCIAGVVALWAGSGAIAGSLLQINLDGMTVAASPSRMFDTPGAVTTVTMELSHNGNSSLKAITIDGATQSIGDAWTLASFSGRVTIDRGRITGGSFELSVTDSVAVNTFTATLADSDGRAERPFGRGAPNITRTSNAFNGLFSGSTFAGIDVSEWIDGPSVVQSFLNMNFRPGRGRIDIDADIEIVSIISAPLPAGVGLGGAGLAAVAGCSSLLRRRR